LSQSYSAKEAVGRSILFLIPSDRRQEEKSILAKIASGERVEHYETVRLRKDGSKVQVSLAISPIKDAAGTIIGASKIARDISHRLKAEQLLRSANSALLKSERQILAVSEEERRRIGADLHDNLGQQLMAIELLCNSLRADLGIAEETLRSPVPTADNTLRIFADDRVVRRGHNGTQPRGLYFGFPLQGNKRSFLSEDASV
jgi:signal transduction histidine kinase